MRVDMCGPDSIEHCSAVMVLRELCKDNMAQSLCAVTICLSKCNGQTQLARCNIQCLAKRVSKQLPTCHVTQSKEYATLLSLMHSALCTLLHPHVHTKSTRLVQLSALVISDELESSPGCEEETDEEQ